MLIDCKKLDTAKLFAVEKQIRNTLDSDQCVFNKYCADNNASINLDMKFNSTSSICYWAKVGLLEETKKLFDYYNIELKKDFKPLVRHFTHIKPWDAFFFTGNCYTPNFLDWWHYCSMTDFYEECKERFEKKNTTLHKQFAIGEKNILNSKIKVKLFGIIPFLKIVKKTEIKE
jgi:hypothetical protein